MHVCTRLYPIWAAFFITLMLSPALYAQQLSPVQFYETHRQATAAAEAGNHAEATALLEQLVRQEPKNADLWNELARAHYAVGNMQEALTAAETVVQLGYLYDESLSFEIALAYTRQGNQEAALDWLERTLETRFSNRPRLRSDDAFASLRTNPRFIRLAGIPPEGLSRDEGLRFDLDYFVEEARRLHIGPDRPAFSPAFEQAVEEFRRQIPSLSDEQVVLGFMRLSAILNDGHTVIYGPGEDTPLSLDNQQLPVKFYLFGDGLFIVDAEEDWRHLVGQKVLRFGPITSEEALYRLREFRGVDNAMTLNWMGPQFYLPRIAMLRGLGATDSDTITLYLQNQAGDELAVELGGSQWEARRKLRPQAAADTTLWLRNVGANYWMQPLDEALYVQFNQVRDNNNGPSIAQFADQVGEALHSSNTTELILDLRHNNGGNNSLVRPLVRLLVAWEVEDPAHRIWVLTGKNTFSAAQNFLNRVERMTNAVIVGEPSSSSPNFAGEDTSLELPWSHVWGSISTRYWQDSDPTDKRSWIYPDIPVPLMSEDYFSNHDPVLDTVLEIIG